jgi:hypothetical protein
MGFIKRRVQSVMPFSLSRVAEMAWISCC